MASVVNLQDKHEVAKTTYVQNAGSWILLGYTSPTLIIRNILNEAIDALYKITLPLNEESHHTAESEEALQIFKEVKKSFRTLSTLNEFLVDQKKVSEALSMYRKVHETATEKFGVDHPSTLTTGNDIGVLLAYQEKYDEALVILKDTFDKSKKKLGPERRITVDLQNNLAYVQDKKYQYAKALCNYSEVFKLVKIHLDRNDSIFIRQHIASLYLKEGKYEESLRIYRDIEKEYKMCQDMLVARNKEFIANVLLQHGEYDEALKLYYDVLEYDRLFLRPEHPFTLYAESNKSEVNRKQHGSHGPIISFSKVWRKQRPNMSLDNPNILNTKHNIGLVYFHQKEYDKAAELFEDTYARIQSILAPEHALTLACEYNLVFVLLMQLFCEHKAIGLDQPATQEMCSKFSRIIKVLREVHRKREKMLGSKHPDALHTAYCLRELTKLGGKNT